MLKAVEGIYRNGKIELSEAPLDVEDGTFVVVTFLEPDAINLRSYGINKNSAALLRERLALFSGDWDDPEMSIYDDYDAAKLHG